MRKVIVSGGFDPLHIGHLRMFEKAKKLGDHLTVILNSDKFLIDKKGFKFMSFAERKEIILGLTCVDKVIKSIDKDNTVCKTLEKLSKKNEIDIFANGGDRKNINQIPEYDVCKKYKIEMIFDIGGDKIQSSSDLVDQFQNYKESRPWGTFENLLKDKAFLVKKLTVFPGQKLIDQYHNHRHENWIVAKGKGEILIGENKFIGKVGSFFYIPKKKVHSLKNIGKSNLIIIEVQTGSRLSENDIVRLKDAYGRA
jgi:D-beta-D-heptose 7-phosphate kinase/D-beta-D-heptose 1-phosphate adenosyltransferase